jgi:hypothetical protein
MDPQTTNAALRRLEPLVGEWDTEISLPGDPATIVRGRLELTWLEGGAFLRVRSTVDKAEFPDSVSIIGCDEAAGRYSMLYFDSRGVARILEMSFAEDVWTLWRDSPDLSQHFSQRYIGRLSDDGNTITGRWEKAPDGSAWELDFELTYTRIG